MYWTIKNQMQWLQTDWQWFTVWNAFTYVAFKAEIYWNQKKSCNQLHSSSFEATVCRMCHEIGPLKIFCNHVIESCRKREQKLTWPCQFSLCLFPFEWSNHRLQVASLCRDFQCSCLLSTQQTCADKSTSRRIVSKRFLSALLCRASSDTSAFLNWNFCMRAPQRK